MSQVFRATPPDATTNILQDNIDQINNDESLRSLFSGTSFPTSPAPVIGQPCYRTDEKLLYIYTAGGWVEASQIGSIPNEVKVARGIQNSLNSRLSVSLNEDGSLKNPTTANVSEWKETGLAVTRVDGTSFEVDTDQTAIFTKYRKLKVNTESSHVIMHVTDTIYDSINDKTIVYVSEFLPATLASVDYGLVQNSVPAQYVVGPDSSADGGFAVFDGTDGKAIKDAGFSPIKGPDTSVDGGIAVFDGTDGNRLKNAEFQPIKGPDSSIDGGIAVFDGTTGKLVKDSGLIPEQLTNVWDVIIEDQKPEGTPGGSTTSGSWLTRDLNTLAYNYNSLASLSNNIFTLPSGTYCIDWSAPACEVDKHKTRLYNHTTSEVIAYGTSEYTTNGYRVSNRSHGIAIVTISTTTSFTIQHICSVSKADIGFGEQVGIGVEIYTRVCIKKIS